MSPRSPGVPSLTWGVGRFRRSSLTFFETSWRCLLRRLPCRPLLPLPFLLERSVAEQQLPGQAAGRAGQAADADVEQPGGVEQQPGGAGGVVMRYERSSSEPSLPLRRRTSSRLQSFVAGLVADVEVSAPPDAFGTASLRDLFTPTYVGYATASD